MADNQTTFLMTLGPAFHQENATDFSLPSENATLVQSNATSTAEDQEERTAMLINIVCRPILFTFGTIGGSA